MKLQTATLFSFLLLGAFFLATAMGVSTDELMKGLDMNTDGAVSQKDFLSFFEALPSKPNLRKLQIDRSDACDEETSIKDLATAVMEWAAENGWTMADLFGMYDANSNGSLDHGECIQLLIDMGCPESEATLKDPSFGAFLDMNNDGNIDFREFKRAILMC